MASWEEMLELPYTLVGNTSIPNPRISILLTAEGIKEIAKRSEEGDMIRISIWDDVSHESVSKRRFHKFELIKKEKPQS